MCYIYIYVLQLQLLMEMLYDYKEAYIWIFFCKQLGYAE